MPRSLKIIIDCGGRKNSVSGICQLKRIKQLLIILLFLNINISNSLTPALAFKSAGQAEIHATVPVKSFLKIFGFTAPNSIVQITGVRVFAQASSDQKGYFLLDEVPISADTIEICAITIDSERRLSFPTCIAAADQIEIGPLLLSPTLSLSADSILENQEAFILGKTLPESQVFLSFFEIPPTTLTDISLNQSFLNRRAYASGIYQSTTKTDKNGNFKFIIPTGQATGLRVFAKAIYNNSPTPKSQTISFRIVPTEEYFVRTAFPLIIRWLIIMAILTVLITLEIRTGKARKVLLYFTQTRLQPFVIRQRLQLRRLMYNLRQWWRSDQKWPFQKYR